jgi:hypothetical protein
MSVACTVQGQSAQIQCPMPFNSSIVLKVTRSPLLASGERMYERACAMFIEDRSHGNARSRDKQAERGVGAPLSW